MSWSNYVKKLIGTGNVKKGAIFGLDGSNWAASKKFKVNKNEVLALVQAFANPAGLHSTGVKIAGDKYTFLRSDGEMIYAKKGGDVGCCVAKTKQTIIVGVYTKGILPGQCNSTVGKLQDFLKSSGY